MHAFHVEFLALTTQVLCHRPYTDTHTISTRLWLLEIRHTKYDVNITSGTDGGILLYLLPPPPPFSLSLSFSIPPLLFSPPHPFHLTLPTPTLHEVLTSSTEKKSYFKDSIRLATHTQCTHTHTH